MPKKQIALTGSVDSEKCEILLNDDLHEGPGQSAGAPARRGIALTVTANGQKRQVSFNEDVALTVTFADAKGRGGQQRPVTFKELTLSNNLALEALVKLLVDTKVIKPSDLQDTMNLIRRERYQTPSE